MKLTPYEKAVLPDEPDGWEINAPWDFKACVYENPGPFELSRVRNVITWREGERDGDSWRWLATLKDGAQYIVEGSCDFTGWDCVSTADYTYVGDTVITHE